MLRCVNVYWWHDEWAHKSRPRQILSLFCGFPQGHNGYSAAQHQTVICYLMPGSLKKQLLSAQLVSATPPPPPLHLPPTHPHPYCMVTKHADRQSKSRQPSLCSCPWRLTSAPDKLSQPCPLQLLWVHSELSVCKLCNWHTDICMFYAQPYLLGFSKIFILTV